MRYEEFKPLEIIVDTGDKTKKLHLLTTVVPTNVKNNHGKKHIMHISYHMYNLPNNRITFKRPGGILHTVAGCHP